MRMPVTVLLCSVLCMAPSGSSCGGTSPQPVPPSQPTDAAPPPTLDARSDSPAPLPAYDPRQPCASAYARLKAGGCEPLSPTTASWLDACNANVSRGQPFGIPCLVKATTIADIAACKTSCVVGGR
jgi:hypothetical protein